MQRRLLLAAVPAFGLGFAVNPGLTQTAPKPMVVSSGYTSGTYYRLMKEFDEAWPGAIFNTESDGSLTNIDRVMGNQAELGITQFDALYFRSPEGAEPQGPNSNPDGSLPRGNPLRGKIG